MLILFEDRMPTISAAQALRDLNDPAARWISTGLRELDAALRNRDVADGEGGGGGVKRGQVTEVFGPPGVGKTGFG
jgi:RecA/RadA recombinase